MFLLLISVSRIQVVRGRKPARGREAAIGALAGGVVGLVGALTTYEECEWQSTSSQLCFGCAPN